MAPDGGSDVGLDGTLGNLLRRRKSHNRLRNLSVTPRGMVDFSSNGYLSLSSNLEVQRAYLARLQHEVAAAAAEPSPSPLLGSGGSRLLDGNSRFAEALERKIAAFHGAPAALLFVSAFDANVGLLGCVPQPGDVIAHDELIHASVHDGMRLSRAGRRIPFSHASVTGEGADAIDGPGGLADVLRTLTGEGGRAAAEDATIDAARVSKDVREGRRNVFVCVESVYSMDGDVLRLDEVVKAVDRYLPRKNGYIILDEAHSTGIFGQRGRGLACKLGLENRVWARVLGFGKAMGCAGGVVLCSETTRSYLINYARSLIYTTSTPFTSLLSIDIVYDYIASGKADADRERLEDLIRQTHQSLLRLCARQVPPPPKHLIGVAKHPPKSPIIPVLTAYPRSLAAHCQRSGFMIRPIVPPTVPPGSERVRICLHAGNTTAQVEGLCSAIAQWLKLHQQEGSEGVQQTLREQQAVYQTSKIQEATVEKPKL
ncbi:hypothetical protein SLS62_004100 [Diatrype stigma]|uniref:Aminotransferase class I/classII large domain-containing protein n=1 Tax=Diatrype stigma TaxID=117547 RepID=A0AAN9UU49_9PEZI